MVDTSRLTKQSPETRMYGPKSAAGQAMHAEKYRGEGEDFREAMQRVSSALSDGEDHYRQFRDILLDMRFMPAGRIQAAMGSTKSITPYNCFVSGTIEDSFVEGHGSIMERAKEAAATMRKGGGIGYDFSTLRPHGAMIRKLGSRSSGPMSFMKVYDSVCGCVQSAGHRRGAQMGVLRVDHPDIETFVRSKQNSDSLLNFNISVAVTDRFMQCVKSGEPFPLTFGGETYREINAASLWEQIMRSTWDWAEPGVLFIDRINQMNNLYYCETIAATNPCGEQPLPPYGACLLGSFNLVKYVRPKGRIELVQSGGLQAVMTGYEFDWDKFDNDTPAVVRAMDNVVDRAIYPLFEQEKEAKSKRRMGLGVTGLANAIEACGHPYGSAGFLKMQDEILWRLAHNCYSASVELAKEKGSFPLLDAEKYVRSGFMEAVIQDDIRDGILRHGIRNSHLTSIAPTGTISFCADNVSSGIEPVFSYVVDRTVKTFDGEKQERLYDYGYKEFGVEGVTADKVTAKQHVEVLKSASRLVDSAVSKTCNVSPDMPWADFKAIYEDSWEAGCKGCTTFNSGGKRFGILAAVGENAQGGDDGDEQPQDGAACYVGADGIRSCE